MNNTLEVTLGDELFSFSSFENWVNTARRQFRRHDVTATTTIALDARGRVCWSGSEFQRARDEDAFPVRVFRQVCE